MIKKKKAQTSKRYGRRLDLTQITQKQADELQTLLRTSNTMIESIHAYRIKWLAIHDWLSQRIKQRWTNYLYGCRLRTEQAYCRLFGVSRWTVKRAFSALEGEGLVVGGRGHRLYVTWRPIGWDRVWIEDQVQQATEPTLSLAIERKVKTDTGYGFPRCVQRRASSGQI